MAARRRCSVRSGPVLRLVKIGGLDPPPWIFGGDTSSCGCRAASIAKQGKASCSGSRHSSRPGLRDLGQSFNYGGDRRRHPDCRSLQVVAAQRGKVQNVGRATFHSRKRSRLEARYGRQVERSEDLRCRRLDLGVDKNGENVWQTDCRAEPITDTPDDSGLGRKTSKDVRSRRPGRSTHSGIVDWQSSLRGKQPQSRRRIRRASAKSGRCRQPLDEPEATEPQPGYGRGEQTRGAHHKILIERPSFPRARTKNLKGQIVSRIKPKPVA